MNWETMVNGMAAPIQSDTDWCVLPSRSLGGKRGRYILSR